MELRLNQLCPGDIITKLLSNRDDNMYLFVGKHASTSPATPDARPWTAYYFLQGGELVLASASTDNTLKYAVVTK